MVLIGIKYMLLFSLFYLTTTIFRVKNGSVANYKGIEVPYSLGTVFMMILLYDFCSQGFLVKSVQALIYLLIIWFFGLLDDVIGNDYPKGLKGHFRLFLKERKVSTGLLKALTTLLASLFIFFSYPTSLPWFFLLLLILLPHSMNLLDTKPLRVWKSFLLFSLTPLIMLTDLRQELILIFLILPLWALYEIRMKAMLGDNGAMLIGAVMALTVLHYDLKMYGLILLVVASFLTIIAERVSIQKWLEKTPILKEIDQFGRIK